ncbi:MAG: gamma-glutamyl-gamma-aminobutyrate hydrolase family protein [Planctomycetota bacterium]|nr:gamma-glutamyl-gamma-aminobutyrate hydrolase family protein [Planctomycetota bacterium]
MPKRLLILNCIAAEAQRSSFDRDVAPELGASFFGAWEVAHLCGDGAARPLPDAGAYSHLILSGSELSAAAENPRDVELCDLIRDFVERGRRVLGICYGHQMIARALVDGACCRRAETPEFGWKRLCLEPDALFEGIPELTAVHSHYDEVFDLPAPLRVIASTQDCAVQAFAHTSRPVWGTQFHPELGFEQGTAMLQDNLRTEARAPELYVDELQDPGVLRWNQVLLQNFFGVAE